MKKKRKSKKRIFGDDRALMMICRDIRRRWMQYGENRKNLNTQCSICNKRMGDQIDHIEPVGPRPRTLLFLGVYAKRMFSLRCQRLCVICHAIKTKLERDRRKKCKE